MGRFSGMFIPDDVPVGKFNKTEIRQMAMDMGFTELANKSESYEICFIPDNDYRSFIKGRFPV